MGTRISLARTDRHTKNSTSFAGDFFVISLKVSLFFIYITVQGLGDKYVLLLQIPSVYWRRIVLVVKAASNICIYIYI